KECGIRLGFAAAGDGGEGRADIGHLLHPLADAGEIGIGLDPAGGVDIERPRLVPIDAVGADDIVDEPALLVEASHMRLAALIADRRKGLLRAAHGVTLPETLNLDAAGHSFRKATALPRSGCA